VPGLVLNEQGVHAGFDQVGDVGAAQRVDIQTGGEAQIFAVAVEPAVQCRLGDKGSALGGNRSSPSVM
jgi:hypothetical protein